MPWRMICKEDGQCINIKKSIKNKKIIKILKHEWVWSFCLLFSYPEKKLTTNSHRHMFFFCEKRWLESHAWPFFSCLPFLLFLFEKSLNLTNMIWFRFHQHLIFVIYDIPNSWALQCVGYKNVQMPLIIDRTLLRDVLNMLKLTDTKSSIADRDHFEHTHALWFVHYYRLCTAWGESRVESPY